MSLRDEQLDVLKVGDKSYDYYRIADLEGVDHLPYSLKVLVENLVRNIDGANITDEQVRELLAWILRPIRAMRSSSSPRVW